MNSGRDLIQLDGDRSGFAIPEVFVDSRESLETLLAELSEVEAFDSCAVDTEADSMHSYETKLCLIQLATHERLAIIDPLAIGVDNLGSFVSFLDRFETVWMHGADYDISMFKMTFDWVPSMIFDTQVAARFLGKEKFGLANLLEEEYGVQLSKQSQKADWSKRPLPDKMLEYAFNDVRYLIDLGTRYLDRLAEQGRMDWFVQSCRSARESVLNRNGRSEDDVWRISGWGKLSPKGLNYLKHLWAWRDDECRRLDRPAFKFVGNAVLIDMAEALQEDRELVPPRYVRPPQQRRLFAAVKEAAKVKAGEYPKKKRGGFGPRLEIDEERFENVRRFRNNLAAQLGIDPTVIATRLAMERLCSENLSDEERIDQFQDWQRELLDPVMTLD